MAWERGRTIGKGSFGTVSLARDSSTGRLFAVKSVDLATSPLPSILSLENEIQILKSLDSPFIVSYLGDSTTSAPASRNLHMEYLPGGTLADVAASPIVDEYSTRAYTLCITRALHYLHSAAGVVHGDVKGRNVLLGPAPGIAKLADFGSARRLADAELRGGCGGAQGTPLWMPPEVARGESATPAADVWSLGCTVIEMVNGGRPLWKCGPGEAAVNVMARIGFGDEVPEMAAAGVLTLSKAGRDFVGRCLRRDKGERWTSEALLMHPFLAEGGGGGPSPRSVLDWVELEIDSSDVEEEEEGDYDDVASLLALRTPSTSTLGQPITMIPLVSAADTVDPYSGSNYSNDIQTQQSWEEARERVRGLGEGGDMAGWGSEGWEDVRGAEDGEGQGRRVLVGAGERGYTCTCSCTCNGPKSQLNRPVRQSGPVIWAGSIARPACGLSLLHMRKLTKFPVSCA